MIGAGVSGLYVADILHSKGVNVKIFEASDQLGGRIRSLRNQSVTQYPSIPLLSSDFPIELGAQTITGSNSIFGQIFHDYNLQTVEFEPSTNRYVMDNLVKSDSEWASDNDYINSKLFIQSIPGSYVGSTQTVKAAIQATGISSRTYGLLNGQIGNARGADNDVIGIGEIAQEMRLVPTDGKVIALKSNPLQDAIISRFSNIQSLVQLNMPVTAVDYSGDMITLTFKDGSSTQVDKLIVTVPVSVLKASGISFNPGLPGSYSSALSKFGMGASLRAVLEFKKNFWGDSIGFIYGSANVPEYLSMGLGRSQFNTTLSVTVNGAKAAQYSAMGDGAIDAILSDIDLLYANQGTQFIRKDITTNNNIYILHDWTKMTYIKGGYSYPLAGATMDDRKALGQPVSNKLFFAGEATDVSGQAGMINGAMASAERAAQDVVTSILNPA